MPAAHRRTIRQAGSFAAIGVASTLAYVAIFAILRTVSPAAVANALALVLTALGNTAANRRLTFDVQGRDGLARDHAAGLLAFGTASSVSSWVTGTCTAVDYSGSGSSALYDCAGAAS